MDKKRNTAAEHHNGARLCFVLALGCCISVAVVPSNGSAQTLMPAQPVRQLDQAKPLALPQQPAQRRQLSSTAFFVDGNGHMLTARHAVENCSGVVVSKEQHRVAGRVVAVSSRYDLALIKVPKTLGLTAVFPRNVTTSVNDMVFAGAYDTLQGMRVGGGMLANARVLSSFGGSEDGHLVMDSPVTFGASGAPVLDRNGLVLGSVSRRTMVNRVLAVGATQMVDFLSANGVRPEQDDRPQLAGSTSRAHRAASISAHIICSQS